MPVEDKVRGLPIVHVDDLGELAELCLDPHGVGEGGGRKR